VVVTGDLTCETCGLSLITNERKTENSVATLCSLVVVEMVDPVLGLEKRERKKRTDGEAPARR
jgi:hypothetical protein